MVLLLLPQTDLSPISLILFTLTGSLLGWLVYRFIVEKMLVSNHSAQNPALDHRQILDNCPQLVWAEKANAVIWANSNYHKTTIATGSDGISAFEKLPEKTRVTGYDRVRLASPDNTREYILQQATLGNIVVYFASDAQPLIETEQELQRFIQTLTGTFAHLPIGLAIFDKKRDLSLFNPALSDLLGLPAEWLARRPSLISFLDRLRSEGILPEPEDFSSLRQSFQDLENGAENGSYNAEWTLSNERIYRVTGRPHTQGGLAFLFEDISNAVKVERRYRAELEQLYSAFDSLADGVVIFDQAGEVVFVNEAFDDLWCTDMGGTITPITVVEFTRTLQKRAKPSPAWGDFREFVFQTEDRSQWQTEFHLNSGETVVATFSPISGRQVFCEFKVIGERATAEKHSLLETG